jgi:PPOX class probable F420-dependent enzyme
MLVPMSRRDAIRMSDDEVLAFLDEQRVVTLATLGRDGWPHLMPLWYVVRDGGIWAWTYAKSQKIRNLRRDPRCTLQVEDGEAYEQLRGVMFRAHATLHDDPETVTGIGYELTRRYGGGDLTPELETAMRAQAAKRIGLSFEVVHQATWDHRKLGGTY